MLRWTTPSPRGDGRSKRPPGCGRAVRVQFRHDRHAQGGAAHPRGFAVAVRHWRDALGLTSADRMQIVTPPSHILGLLNIVMALDTGAWIRLHRRFDIDQMLHHIEADRITIEMAVAPIALALAAHPKLDSYDLSSLRYVMWCATPVTQSVAEAVTDRAGVNWVTAYGTSELPVIACNSLEGPSWTPWDARCPVSMFGSSRSRTASPSARARWARFRPGRIR